MLVIRILWIRLSARSVGIGRLYRYSWLLELSDVVSPFYIVQRNVDPKSQLSIFVHDSFGSCLSCYLVGDGDSFLHDVRREEVEVVDNCFFVGHDYSRLWSRVVGECS